MADWPYLHGSCLWGSRLPPRGVGEGLSALCAPGRFPYLEHESQEMRLELSSKTDLALRALRHLSDLGERAGRDKLALVLRTTPDYLARVMAPLVNHGWVDSRPGRLGGYEIAPKTDRLSVLDVINAVEGVPLDRCVLRSGPCEPDRFCSLHQPWSRARDALLSELASSPVFGNGGSNE
jgi:Rrf2 family protein